jgi:hypothetical protein
MNRIIFVTLLFLSVIYSAGYGQEKKNGLKLKADTVRADSVEYELIVIDPGFESWIATKPPKQFYSKEYYEQKNNLDVIEWNTRFLSAGNSGLYDSYINYSPDIDYGLDLNYMLYYYFRFFEEKNKTRLYSKVR